MEDADAINEAYSARLGDLYKTMFASFIAAAGKQAEEQKAEAAFKAGVALARKVRDRAIAQL